MIVTGKVPTTYTSYNNRKQGLGKGGGAEPPPPPDSYAYEEQCEVENSECQGSLDNAENDL